MRRRSRFNSTGFKIRIGALAILAIFGGVFLIQLLDKDSDSGALSATEFKAGRIIDDSVFYNPNTMTAAEIDAFIDSHTSACDTWGTQKIGNTRFYGVQASNNTTRAEYMKYMRNAGYTQYHDAPFICVRDYYENPKTHKTNFETGGKVEPGMISAGQIIYNAAHEYNVNPQVLLVMLKKESYAWGDDWPLKFEYNTVMGYGCPDNAACDQDYFGFYNQVMTAAWQLNYYREHPNDYRYRPGRDVNIYYSPDYSCGTKSVYIENYATAGLYIYTPYTPNDAALANYPGTAWCGSYGNRNFYMYFREWFGSTLGADLKNAKIDAGEYYITLDDDINTDWQLDSSASQSIVVRSGTRINNSLDNFSIVLNDGGSYTIKNVSTNKVLDITSGSIRPGTKIQQWEQNNSTAQKWQLLDNGDGSYYIASIANKNLVVAPNETTSELELQYIDFTQKSQRIRLVVTEQVVPNGVYRILSASHPSYSIDIKNSVFANYTNIQILSQNSSTAQRFRFEFDSNRGLYTITDLSDKYSLDVSGAKKSNGTNIQLCQISHNDAQLWAITKNEDGSYTIRSPLSGKVLDISEARFANGSNIQIWEYNKSGAQKWVLQGAPESSQVIEDGYYMLSDPSTNYIVNIDSKASAKALPKDKTDNKNSILKITFDKSAGYYTLQINSTQKYLETSSYPFKKEQTSLNLNGLSKLPNQYWALSEDTNKNIVIKSAVESETLPVSEASATAWALTKATEQELSAPTQQNPIQNSTIDTSRQYELLSKANSRYAIDIQWANYSNGTNIQLYERNRTPAQKFTFKSTGVQNEYYIYSSNRNFVLDVSGASTANGANVQLWEYNGSCAQKWNLEKNADGSYTFYNRCSGKVLDLSGARTASGSNIQIWESNQTNAQKWFLE